MLPLSSLCLAICYLDEVSDIESLDGLDTEASVGALEGEIDILANFTDPTKLDSLKGKPAATPRLRKTCYWLHTTSNSAEAID